jgi:hypothetical protein
MNSINYQVTGDYTLTYVFPVCSIISGIVEEIVFKYFEKGADNDDSGDYHGGGCPGKDCHFMVEMARAFSDRWILSMRSAFSRRS